MKLLITDRNQTGCPDLVGVRPEADVKLLLEAARNSGVGRSWAAIFNLCARAVLTPKFKTKRIANIQEKLGVTEKNFGQ